MEDSMKKEKLVPTETAAAAAASQHIPDDQTPPSSPNRLITPSPSSPPPQDTAALQQQFSSTYVSSKSAEPKLVHSFRSFKVQTRLEFTHPNDSPITLRQETPPQLSRINLSSIPLANRRPFFNPRPQRSQPSSEPVTESRSRSSNPIEQNIAARLRLMKPIDRVELKRTGQINRPTKHKRNRASKPGPGRILGPSPLGPGPTPYQKVQKSLTELKHFINSVTSSNPGTSQPEDAPPQRLTDPATAQTSTCIDAEVAPELAECSNSSEEVDKWSLRVEDVVKMLDAYMEKVPRTIGAQEMEDGLLEIQNKVGVDPMPTWYALMCKSYEDMWECLIDYFSCEALEDV